MGADAAEAEARGSRDQSAVDSFPEPRLAVLAIGFVHPESEVYSQAEPWGERPTRGHGWAFSLTHRIDEKTAGASAGGFGSIAFAIRLNR